MNHDQKKIAVGMSGGVDSTAAAYLLQKAGYDVIGLTLRLYDSACRRVGLDDTEKAAEVARLLGIEHHVIDARDYFYSHIIHPFARCYACGRTPSPCVRCNERVKFGLLMERAFDLGCDAVATGHYVQREQDTQQQWHLYRSKNKEKDQSYFLHRLTQHQLAHAVFPLEGMQKEEVRNLITKAGLVASQEVPSESQDLCFVENGRYVAWVESFYPELVRRGTFTNAEGHILGTHDGFYHYTVGQRKGIGIAGPFPYYVTGVDAKKNRVIIGPREETMCSSCSLGHLVWIAGKPPMCDGLTVQLRYQSKPVAVQCASQDDERLLCEFASPQFAVTPGQAAVFYKGNEVLGGGWID
ncbi:MAG: tRNA 2-thiouridine(34) synthase MnmA [Spartobacteria bacterium]|nr:tRNA 2-thiouridine(34) synthase MnmA [Spartobacteria bacterium]